MAIKPLYDNIKGQSFVLFISARFKILLPNALVAIVTVHSSIKIRPAPRTIGSPREPRRSR